MVVGAAVGSRAMAGKAVGVAVGSRAVEAMVAVGLVEAARLEAVRARVPGEGSRGGVRERARRRGLGVARRGAELWLRLAFALSRRL